MKSRRTNRSHFLAVSVLLASSLSVVAELKCQVSANEVAFKNGAPVAADATGTITNEKGEDVATGKLIVVGKALILQGKRGASFAYSPPREPFVATNWPIEGQTNLASVAFDGKGKWVLQDDHFSFMLEYGFVGGKILLDESLLFSSRVGLPEGTYSLWGYSITVSNGGGSVVFKSGLPTGAENAVFVKDLAEKARDIDTVPANWPSYSGDLIGVSEIAQILATGANRIRLHRAAEPGQSRCSYWFAIQWPREGFYYARG